MAHRGGIDPREVLIVVTPAAQDRPSWGAAAHRSVTEDGYVVRILDRAAPHAFKPLLRVAGDRDVLVVTEVDRLSFAARDLRLLRQARSAPRRSRHGTRARGEAAVMTALQRARHHGANVGIFEQSARSQPDSFGRGRAARVAMVDALVRVEDFLEVRRRVRERERVRALRRALESEVSQ